MVTCDPYANGLTLAEVLSDPEVEFADVKEWLDEVVTGFLSEPAAKQSQLSWEAIECEGADPAYSDYDDLRVDVPDRDRREPGDAP